MTQLIDLKVGPLCNNKCIHCLAAGDLNELDLSTQRLKDIIEEFVVKYSSIDLTLTGGEITVRRDFTEIMRFIKLKKSEGGIREVHLQTNGRLLSSASLLDECIGVVDYYLVALHSNVPHIHNFITKNKNSFYQTSSALSDLVTKVNPKSVAIQTVISKHNLKTLASTYKFVHETYGITECNITFPHPMGSAYNTAVTPTYKEVVRSVGEAMDYCFGEKFYPLTEALPFCVFDKSYYSYLYETQRRREIGAIGYGSEADGIIDYSSAFADSNVKYPSCQHCALTQICVGVWKEYQSLYPSEESMPGVISG